nr:hypothetical protein [Tanacetum cinerariifolium]
MNMGQDRQMQMIGGNGGNQFRQNAGNLNGYNEVQNVGNQVAPNPRIQNVGNQNGLIGVQRNGIQNQIGNGNIMAVRTEGNAAGQNGNQIKADDQAIQTILLGLPKDIYATVDSCETAQEIWIRVQQMMKGSDIRIQEKKAKNKHFPKKIASNLNFLNNLQPEWSRHVTTVHQTKDLHTADYTQLYDFLKYNQKKVDELKAERLAKTRDPLALMANSNNPYAFPNAGNHNGFIGVQGNGNQNQIENGNLVAARAEGNAAGQNENQIRCYNCRRVGHYVRNCTVRPMKRDAAYLQKQLFIAQKEEAGIQLQAEEYDLIVAAADLEEIEEVNANCILMANLQQASTSGTQTDSAPVYDTDGSAKEEAEIQLQAKEFDFMAAAGDLDEIKEVNANCILMANLQQASTSGTQHDRALVYDTDGSAEVHLNENCYDNEIFNMFTQEEQYTDLLEPIPEPQLVPQ